MFYAACVNRESDIWDLILVKIPPRILQDYAESRRILQILLES